MRPKSELLSRVIGTINIYIYIFSDFSINQLNLVLILTQSHPQARRAICRRGSQTLPRWQRRSWCRTRALISLKAELGRLGRRHHWAPPSSSTLYLVPCSTSTSTLVRRKVASTLAGRRRCTLITSLPCTSATGGPACAAPRASSSM